MRELAVLRQRWERYEAAIHSGFRLGSSPTAHIVYVSYLHMVDSLYSSFLQVFELCSIELFLSVCIKLHLEKHRISESPSFRSCCLRFLLEQYRISSRSSSTSQRGNSIFCRELFSRKILQNWRNFCYSSRWLLWKKRAMWYHKSKVLLIKLSQTLIKL